MAPEAHLSTGSKSLILASYLSTGTTKASIVCFMVLIVSLLVVHWDFGWFTGTSVFWHICVAVNADCLLLCLLVYFFTRCKGFVNTCGSLVAWQDVCLHAV